jgi:tetratricopeptide (TPR) repeat protein
MIGSGVEYSKSPNPARRPVVIPVSSEDFHRSKQRIIIAVLAAVAVLAGGIVYAYKRSVDIVHARESFDSGVRLLSVASYSQAVLSFDRAVGLKSDFADAYLMRGKAYQGDSKSDEAIDDFSRVIALRPNDPRGFVARSAVYLDRKKYAKAMEDASRAIELDPRLAAAYNLRGLAVRALGDGQRALADFNRAVELEPNEDNYYQRGATYQMLDQHALAIADLNHVIAIRPDASPGFLARAQSRRAIGDYEGAQMDETRVKQIEGMEVLPTLR